MLSQDASTDRDKLDDDTSRSNKLQIRPQKIDTNLNATPEKKIKKKVQMQ